MLYCCNSCSILKPTHYHFCVQYRPHHFAQISANWKIKLQNCTSTRILLTWTIWRASTNASKWRMGFNSAFKGLRSRTGIMEKCCYNSRSAVFEDRNISSLSQPHRMKLNSGHSSCHRLPIRRPGKSFLSNARKGIIKCAFVPSFKDRCYL